MDLGPGQWACEFTSRRRFTTVKVRIEGEVIAVKPGETAIAGPFNGTPMWTTVSKVWATSFWTVGYSLTEE